MNQALEDAIRVADGVTALAELIGVEQPHISKWKKNGVPAKWCKAIEKATSKTVTCYDLRPDIFPEPEQTVVNN